LRLPLHNKLVILEDEGCLRKHIDSIVDPAMAFSKVGFTRMLCFASCYFYYK